jgi:phosphatidylserine/phosphatidylglycerophosphate/cardiolipin synthase-like enzyme
MKKMVAAFTVAFLISGAISWMSSHSELAYSKSGLKNKLKDETKSDSWVSSMQEAVRPIMIAPPKDLEVCFSPQDPCDLKLIKFLDSAEKSLDIAIYDINIDELVHHVLLKSRKIPVRIVVDRRQSKGSHSLVNLLVKAGAKVKFGRQRGIMHNKFMIVDGKALETGSFNYTNHAFKANRENQIYLWNPQVVEQFQREFEILWESGRPAENG